VIKAVIKYTEYAADYSFALPAAAWRPSESKARREIAPVVNVVLRFVAKPQTDGEIRAQAPIILHERPDIDLVNLGERIAACNRELGSAAAQGPDLLGRKTLALK